MGQGTSGTSERTAGHKLTEAQKEELGRKAWCLSAKGLGHRQIAKEIGVNRNTVGRLLDAEREKKREEWKDEDLKSVVFYEAEIRYCHETRAKVEKKTGLQSQNISALTNAGLEARKQIDRIAGTHAPTKVEGKHRHDLNILDVEALSDELVHELEEEVLGVGWENQG